ncbi:MAG: methylase [Fluviicola sp.]|nr:MAG: methylase [Fluviicola sp.]
MSDFDGAAISYDEKFTFSSVGIIQRNLVWHNIKKINLEGHQNVLEVNCGTGEDAKRWSGLNKSVKSTDISPKMIELAQSKFPEIDFKTFDITEIKKYEENYDLLFSNFGGLNCLSTDELETFFCDVYKQLPSHGRMILVIMGKKCFWDRVFLILKGKWKERNRRNTESFIEVNVDQVPVKTWYYSPKETKSFVGSQFETEGVYPIGLFVPPSYLANRFKNKNRLMKFLEFLDKLFSFRFLANYADHYLIVLKKN